jgi:hypothetical protein
MSDSGEQQVEQSTWPVEEPTEAQQDGYEEELSPWQVVDSIMGQPTEEEVAEREAEDAEQALASGEAVRQIAEEQAALSNLGWDLVDK